MITEIKLNGFQKNRKLIEDRLRKKAKLESSIQSLRKQINYVNFQKKDFGTVYTRISNEIVKNDTLANVISSYLIIFNIYQILLAKRFLLYAKRVRRVWTGDS